ncbi:site-specific DNA-methyltransferase [Streptosporangium sp. V21-05]|uniref:site-specific DNA-methyltransferase n=1 Tax=Streptosporangium sp. V21-05 TaxID=3446115 RepID=UPI003F529754
MPLSFEPVDELTGPGEAKSNIDLLARLFPDAVVDGSVDFDALRNLLGENAAPTTAEAFGLRWPGMAEARSLSTVPATGTLLPKPEESVGWETTKNIVIEGDNLEVLRLLRRHYINKVDVIYIDPPYNTGNDFVYDDKRTTTQAAHEAAAGQRDEEGILQIGEASDRAQDRKAGASRHSIWLSMMYPRMLVAHQLLTETGVIIVAIDDTEHARLKLLMDRVFGAENFIANLIWQGGRKNDSRYVSVGHDYMLVYAKNEAMLRSNNVRWREERPTDGIIREAAKVAWNNSGGDTEKATKLMKEWIKSLPQGHPAKENNRFYEFDPDGRVSRKRDISWPDKGGPKYEVIHPVTGLPVKVPERGWRYASPERMQQEIDANRIIWGKDHNEYINGKTYLDSEDGMVPSSVFEKKRASASNALDTLLGAGIFGFPKDAGVLSRWIDLATYGSREAVILDFFAGSGSTGHAVMDLNARDGGCRKYILIQLDEPVDQDGYNTIADITRERLRRAGQQIAAKKPLEAADIDTGFRSYRLAASNVRPWDGTADQLDLVEAVDNLVAGRTTDDLLVEMMLRLGLDLTTPVETREIAGSTLYNLVGTLFAYFGTDITVARANEVAKALVVWRDEAPVDSETTVVVRDTGFLDSAAKLNFAAALEQAGFSTLRSI